MGFPWGLDFGNQNCVIAIARKGGIDVIDNEASSRKVSSSTLFWQLRT
jgi:molecular chaperone DnaK (HSP70)